MRKKSDGRSLRWKLFLSNCFGDAWCAAITIFPGRAKNLRLRLARGYEIGKEEYETGKCLQDRMAHLLKMETNESVKENKCGNGQFHCFMRRRQQENDTKANSQDAV